MAMSSIPQPVKAIEESVELQSGDRMTRPEFHRAYLRTPDRFKAELVGGIVYVASPLRLKHGTNHPALSALLFIYQMHTPGVQMADNTTILLGHDSEPQPDLFLRILPEYGGQSRTTADDYLEGAPELIVEIAHSSKAIDLHAKRADYQRFGVQEYLVHVVADRELRWFDLRMDQERFADADGICRIQTFPGLWIDSAALGQRDDAKLVEQANKGLASPEHVKFVAQLGGQRSTSSG